MLNMIKALYSRVKGVVELSEVRSDEVNMESGLKQGCTLSPILFALYVRDLGEDLSKNGEGINLGNSFIFCRRYGSNG